MGDTTDLRQAAQDRIAELRFPPAPEPEIDTHRITDRYHVELAVGDTVTYGDAWRRVEHLYEQSVYFDRPANGRTLVDSDDVVKQLGPDVRFVDAQVHPAYRYDVLVGPEAVTVKPTDPTRGAATLTRIHDRPVQFSRHSRPLARFFPGSPCEALLQPGVADPSDVIVLWHQKENV